MSKLSGKLADTFSARSDRGPWQPSQGDFPRLMLLELEEIDALKDTGGLFALWHRGVRPQWIYVGHTVDLATTIIAAQSDADIGLYNLNDGVYMTWAFCPEGERAGAVLYLRQALSPAIAGSLLGSVDHIPDETKPSEFPLPVD
ncbi:MAG: hypothetical protein GKS03_14825 [Alphaproteobacteria bacterium]|nr:hypothetical protein [Alphaproteobacteria bacterium]